MQEHADPGAAKAARRHPLLAGRRVPWPRHLIIEISSFCNLRCRMCPKTHHAVNTQENRVMSREVFERLIPLLRHIESLDLTGVWGEALMHPELYLDMLKTIKAHGSDVYTTSNGTLLTDDLARQLVELDLNKLMVSVDAATPETYARIRPPGKFQAVTDGLRSLKAWKERLSRTQPRVEVAFVGMKSNIEEFPALVRMAPELGAAQVTLQAMGEYPGLENESVAAHHKALGRAKFEESRRIGDELGVRVALLPEDQFAEDRQERNAVRDTRRYRKQCYDLWNRALVSANGDVLPCCAAPVPMGSLLASTFAEIWRGPAYNALRAQFLSGELPEMCRLCTGTAWVEDSPGRDLRFYLTELLLPRVRRQTKRKLKQYAAARWAKRLLDGLRARR